MKLDEAGVVNARRGLFEETEVCWWGQESWEEGQDENEMRITYCWV